MSSHSSNSDGSDSDYQSDVEAQVDGLRSYPIGFNIPKRTVAEFMEEYSVKPLLRTSLPFHEHPHLAFCRNFLEQKALKLVDKGQLIGDVGSAGRILRNSKYNVHCLCPYLQPGDDRRLNTANKTGNTVCRHTLQSCTCGPFDLLLFTHSAYYFNWVDFKEALKATRTKSALVIGHLFPEAFGCFRFKEGVYQVKVVDQKLIYETKVIGNDHVYSHPPLLWDHGGQPGDDEYALDVDRISKMGETYLWRVTLVAPRAKLVHTLDYSEQVVDPTYSGPIRIPGWDQTAKQSMAAINLQLVDYDSVEAYGPIIMTATIRGEIMVPKAAIEMASLKIMFRERNAATFQDVAHHVRTSFANSRMPAGDIIKAATMAVGLAFCRNMQNESDVLHTVTSRFGLRAKLHAQLLTMKGVFAIRWWMFLLWFLFVITLIIILSTTTPLPWGWVLLYGSIAGLICVLPFLVCYGCLVYSRKRAGEGWLHNFASTGSTSSVGVAGGVFDKPAWLPSMGQLREPLLPTAGAQLLVGTDRAERRHPGAPSEAIGLAGIAIAQAAPAVPTRGQASEITAITHRVLIPPTVVDDNVVEFAFDPVRSAVMRQLSNIRISEDNDDFEKWVNDPKWTGSEREKFIRLRREWVDRPPRTYNYKAFLKMEKLKHHDRDGAPIIKPRMICGPPDEVKVMVGPTSAKFAKALREAWDGKKCRVVYVNGYTPDGLGHLLDDWVADNGGWSEMLGLADDGVVYDAHCQNELLNKTRSVKAKAGYSDRTMGWILGGRAAVTKHGIKFVRGQKKVNGMLERIIAINSGEMDTNIDGSLINGILHDAAVPQDVPCLILVCGDDNFILVNAKYWNIELTNNVKTFLESAGLEVTQLVSPHRHDWEFCSKLFWWGVDRDGNSHTVLGPKPGRWLHRIAWNVSVGGTLNFRGAMISASQDVAHVPLLNVYVMKSLQLTTGMKRSGRQFDFWKHVQMTYRPDPRNIEILRNRYGLSNEHVLEFEERVHRVTKVPAVIDFPWIEAMADKDEE